MTVIALCPSPFPCFRQTDGVSVVDTAEDDELTLDGTCYVKL